MIFKKIFLVIGLLAVSSSIWAEKREIAITIDDLPFVGEGKNYHLTRIVETLRDNEIHATGFIIAGKVREDNWPVLRKFREAGLGLGNHTLSHANLNKVGLNAFVREIDDADKILAPLITEPRFFRYPYLAMGKGERKEKVLEHLAAKNYQVAPITIDSKDYIFNQLLLSVPESQRRDFLTALKPCYLDFLRQQTLKAEEDNRFNRKTDRAQILLIHANLLNAYVLPDIIHAYKQEGFTFVSLEDALKTFAAKPKTIEPKKEDEDRIFLAWD